jgi:hypothetical protein
LAVGDVVPGRDEAIDSLFADALQVASGNNSTPSAVSLTTKPDGT